MTRRLFHPEAARIALTYAFIAGMYIVLSDRILSVLQPDPQTLSLMQTYKGWGFVVVTAALLYLERARAATANDRTQQALRASEDRYHSLFEHAPISLWEIDLAAPHARIKELASSGIDDLAAYLETHADVVTQIMSGAKITAVNQGTVSLYEAADKHEVLAHLSALIHASSESWLRDLIGKIASGVREHRMEIVTRAVNGDALYLDMRWVVEPSAEHDYGRVLVSIADLTRLHAAQQEALRLNACLEERVKERTEQLLAANQELEAFAYSVSHDLRAPLRAIDGFSQALLEDFGDSLGGPAAGYAKRIRAGSERMAQLIDDLLQLSRLSRLEMSVVRIDLSAAARDVADSLQRAGPTRQVHFDIEPGLVAWGDAHLMRIALENLLGNAWKFTSRHAQARIQFGATSDSDGRTQYYVRDDGAGFDMAYAGKLFGAFQRLHSISDFEGTGIGLATVQRIIRRHGGSIWAEGKVEQGACFYFTLNVALHPEGRGSAVPLSLTGA